MINEEQRARIRRLFFGEHWRVGTIAEQLGLHRDTIKGAIGVDSFASRDAARPSALDAYVDFVRTTLTQYPKLTGTRMHEMLRVRGYEGSVSQVRRRIREQGLRPTPRSEAYFRLVTMPGEQAQVDWAHLGTIRIGLFERPLSAFVMVLSWSRALHVYFSLDQTLPSVLRGHVEAFHILGGVPRQILYDNMKTVVLERAGDAIRFHPGFLELSAHYLFQALPCAPARPNEKGRVERRIRDLRSSFLAGRHFSDIADLREQFVRWRDEVAYQRRCPGSPELTVGEALEREQERLMPLPLRRFDTTQTRAVVARKQPYVSLDTNRYSIPPSLVGHPLTLAASEQEVRVLRGQEVVARHQRCWDHHITIEAVEHIKEMVELKQKARSLKGRERLLEKVPEATALMERLAQRNERLGSHTAKLLELLDLYGQTRLTEAVLQAIERGTPGADSVAYLLERTIDPQDPIARPLLLQRAGVSDLRITNHDLKDYDDLSNDQSQPE